MRWVWVCWLFAGMAIAAEQISFKAPDGLEITAEVSLVDSENAPFLVLCHQAGWSRGEYKDTMGWFNGLGFHVMALDQRSGKGVNGVTNLTAQRAREKGLATEYADAKQDIEAALRYVVKTYAPKTLGLVGSSYSASLVLRIAGEKQFPLSAVLAFSPGEYFAGNKRFVQEKAANIDCLVFITSAAKEQKQWLPIASVISKDHLNAFVPSEAGEHGSRALWEGKSGWKMYRRATQAFLARLKQ